MIEGFFQQSGRIARTFAISGLPRGLDLFPIRMVFHSRSLGLRIKEHLAIRRDMGETDVFFTDTF